MTGPPRLGGIFKSQIVFQLPAPAAKTSISKEEISSELVKVYPSPAREVVNIALPVEMMKSANIVRLITTDGKVIETKRTKAANLVQFNTDKLSPGMYIVHIQSGSQTITKTIAIVR